MESRRIPKFENEAEEAQWWFDHREEISQDIVIASREGRLGEGSRARFQRRMMEQEQGTVTREHANVGDAPR
jgi:hypothetical protein